jgi:regulator of sigma E protease
MTEHDNMPGGMGPEDLDQDLFDMMTDKKKTPPSTPESAPSIPSDQPSDMMTDQKLKPFKAAAAHPAPAEDTADMMTDKENKQAPQKASASAAPADKPTEMMTDKKAGPAKEPAEPPRPQSKLSKLLDLAVAIGIVIAIIVFILKAPGVAGTVALVVLGFGAVVFIHELGHFIVAKLGGIKVEAFSIGFPPTILSVRKLRRGFRVRLFPKVGQDPQPQEGDSETEYWLGIIPFGGFVKMLGQSDSGAAEKTDDPRSFQNRPIWIRISVVAAGVVFNVISAVILFMGLYLYGLQQQPAVVGEITPDSPAEAAGFRPGDRVIAIDGKSFIGEFVDFSTISLAGALSRKGESTKFTVRREDGQIETLKAVAELEVGDPQQLRHFGIQQAATLSIAALEDPAYRRQLEESGFQPGDLIQAVDGKPVRTSWQMKEYIHRSVRPEVNLTIRRPGQGTADQLVTVSVPMKPSVLYPNFHKEYDLANLYSMVPLLQVDQVFAREKTVGLLEKTRRWFRRSVLHKAPVAEKPAEPNPFQKGDILVRVADVQNPTFPEYRQALEARKDKSFEVEVLRADGSGGLKSVTFPVTPWLQPRTKNRIWLGITLEFAMHYPVVAQTVDTPMAGTLLIPRGAKIEKVDNQPVTSFYQIAEIFDKNAGQRLGIDFRLSDTDAGSVGILVPGVEGAMHMWSESSVPIPLDILKERVKTSNPAQAVMMGAKKTWYFAATTVLTLKGLFTRDVPTSALSGPVGIISISYQVARQSFIDFLYFMGLISACIAVMNLLPIPVVDGGVIVLLLIEKIKGGPIPEKVHAAVTYVGLALLLAVLLWITYNDIYRIIFGA